ncbi:sodium/glucose cotransporter 4-like [Ylistrum balloti]|uniref:sodium/glucose cotransporter 4-like n=1 Tax=Ylistrum balloti TaxID=509963 RepID=UPI002905E55A|nr:sodium/glucose cotransporter 4-like [Ylistrum balloti]
MSSNATGSAFSSATLGTVDIVVIVIYLVFCLATGIWATVRTERGSVSGYFLAGRDMLWFAIGASLFSSNIGSGSFVGLAGTGAANGIAVASYELNGLFCLLLLGWLFVPIYISSGVYTLPEYLMRRFGGQRLQIYMAVLSLLIYVFTKISVDMFAGTIFIQQAVGWDLYAGVFLLLGISALYTVSGGLKAVMYTDTLQTVIMVAGSLVLMVLSKLDGAAKLTSFYLIKHGLKGLMLAAMMAALMSSLSSVFNSTTTIFTLDIWKRLRPKSSDGELLIVGRVFVLVLVVVSIIWIPVLRASQGGQLFNYIQSVSGYLVPPVLSLFLLAMLWTRTNESGAFWGLMVGLLVGLIRLGLDFGYGSPACGEEEFRPSFLSQVHFLHFTIILFFISLFTTIIISILTQPIHPKHLVRLTWWTRHSTMERVPFEEEKETNRISEEARLKRITELKERPVEISRWKSFVYLICGYEPPKEVIESEEVTAKQSVLTDIREVPKWKVFVNVNAILLMVIGMFLWGFFG